MRPWDSDEGLHAKLRQRLLAKGGELAAQLAEVLAGKDVCLENLPALGPDDAQLRPEELLRAFLDLVERRRHLLEAHDARYGACDVCGVELSRASMEEQPWADRCQACSSKRPAV